MNFALCQVNPTVADLAGNVNLCLQAVRRAANHNPDLILLPEMVIPGYPPRDLLYDPHFVTAVEAANADFAALCQGLPPVLFGSFYAQPPRANPLLPRLVNAAFLARYGSLQVVAEKQLLPVYDVFYEPRWFLPGRALPPITIAGQKVGVLICEDLWDEGYDQHPAAALQKAGAQILVSISASPYRQGILQKRMAQVRRAAPNTPLVFVNLVGANDELIFDGQSFIWDGEGFSCLSACTEETLLTRSLPAVKPAVSPPLPGGELPTLFSALTLGIADFARKNGLRRAVLGVSGGIDSALALVLAVRALGAENVTAVAIPSRYSDPRSLQAARELCNALGCPLEEIDLEPLHATAERILSPLPAGQTPAPADSTLENVQARLRMIILMAFVNRQGGFLLNTSNKTELSLGYSTLYGDMAGALCPLADLTKPQVYALARYAAPELIPAFVLERLPSAELRPEQVDPFDYETISPLLEEIVEADGAHPALKRSEHKRWQTGIVLKVSERAFGSGRLFPVTKA